MEIERITADGYDFSTYEDPSGEFVYYEDHKSIVDCLNKRIQELENKLSFDMDDAK